MNAEVVRKILPTDFHTRFLEQGLRPDNRKLLSPRKVHISLDVAGQHSSIVKLGNTIVLCKVSKNGEKEVRVKVKGGAQGLADVLGQVDCYTKIKIIADDGNISEWLCLAYYSALDPSSMPLAFTFADLYGHTIRDPTTEEESLSNSIFTVLLQNSKVNVVKQKGLPISIDTLYGIIEGCQASATSAKTKLAGLGETRHFSGKLD